MVKFVIGCEWLHRRCKKGPGASTSVACKAGQIYQWTFVCWLVLAAAPLSCVRVRASSQLCCTTMPTALDPGPRCCAVGGSGAFITSE